MTTRRQFLSRSATCVGAVAILTGLYTWRVEPHWVQFSRRRLPLRDLPRDLVGRTLVQLSDFHVGPLVDDQYLIDVCEEVRGLAPDFVVFTGDFISYTRTDLDQLAAVLRHFPLGRLGTFGILGNHDYGPGWSRPEIAAAVTEVATRAGIKVLRNEGTVAAGLQLIGLDDLWANRFSLSDAFHEVDPRAATLVLSHNPDTMDHSGWPVRTDWILSGHTHGGQCKPPFLPPPILPVRNKRYTAGEIALSGNRMLYINRGIGHLMRVRFNCRPEVTIFRLEDGART